MLKNTRGNFKVGFHASIATKDEHTRNNPSDDQKTRNAEDDDCRN